MNGTAGLGSIRRNSRGGGVKTPVGGGVHPLLFGPTTVA